jgi:reversibly glycosylated polypeptide
MKKNRASVVFTTIFDSPILDNLFENFSKFNHLDQVRIFVIPDLKTPQKVFERCQYFNDKGLNVFCPTVEEQEKYLKKIGFPSELIPYNSDNRRNIGFLMAMESGNDFLISIDDDNFCQKDEDFFAGHEIVCNENVEENTAKTADGWFNICELLDFNPDVKVYPRGFPYFARHRLNKPEKSKTKSKVGINQGLWLMDPDIDGISWLVNPAKATKFKGESITLAQNTWSPINTQNTSLCRDVIPSYYFVKMGYPLAGIPIDRYGDIFSGYFAEKCVKSAGHTVRFGNPIAEHRRNSHNYMNDAANEWSCILVLEDLLPALQEMKLEGNNYSELYINLSHSLEEVVERFKGKIWTDATKGFFHQIAFIMRKWITTVKTLQGN